MVISMLNLAICGECTCPDLAMCVGLGSNCGATDSLWLSSLTQKTVKRHKNKQISTMNNEKQTSMTYWQTSPIQNRRPRLTSSNWPPIWPMAVAYQVTERSFCRPGGSALWSQHLFRLGEALPSLRRRRSAWLCIQRPCFSTALGDWYWGRCRIEFCGTFTIWSNLQFRINPWVCLPECVLVGRAVGRGCCLYYFTDIVWQRHFCQRCARSTGAQNIWISI